MIVNHHILSFLNQKTIHQLCINVLIIIQVYKYLGGISPELLNGVFYLRQHDYNLNIFNVFAADKPPKNHLLSSTTN